MGSTHTMFLLTTLKRIVAGLLVLLAAQYILSSVCLLPNTQKGKTVHESLGVWHCIP